MKTLVQICCKGTIRTKPSLGITAIISSKATYRDIGALSLDSQSLAESLENKTDSRALIKERVNFNTAIFCCVKIYLRGS
jgi:hypothetical protein